MKITMKNVKFFDEIGEFDCFYYVNHHPKTKKPIYVGVGKGKRYLPNGHEHHNKRWMRLLKKYGYKDIITYVFYASSMKNAHQAERELIHMFRSDGYDLYNMTDGGEGTGGLVHTLEHIAKRITPERNAKASKVLREKNASKEISTGPEKGVYKHTPEEIEKIRRASLHQHANRSLEEKEEINAKISKSNTGKKHSEESKEKNRQWHLGRKQSEETKRKRLESRRKTSLLRGSW